MGKGIDFLNSLNGVREEWDLEDTRRLLNKIGDPHENLKVIHVAGTNGKGSVSAMIASILKESGYKVGLYTSPFLVRVTEKIRINGEEISKKELEKYLLELKPSVDKQSYFELLTVLALKYFKDNDVDFVVLETGLGGRLDATNVCDSMISVITNISLEHTDHLGDTVEKIAGEKAGIIKPNSYCVTGAEGVALEVIKKKCEEMNTELFIARPTSLELGVKGEFQKENAGVAIKTIKRLKHYDINIPKKSLIDGLEKVKWPGRFEFIDDGVLVDCAHNPAAMSKVAGELRMLNYNNLILVLGILADKDVKTVVNEIVPLASKIIITKPNSDRAASPKEVAKYIDGHYLGIDNPKMALQKAKELKGDDDLILVTGSFYTVGEVYVSN